MDLEYVDRFWAQVDKSENCWLWTGYTQPQGYGQFSIKGQPILGHRFAYEREFGPLSDGVQVIHTCNSLACVRPSHLQAVTRKQKMERRTGANANSKSGVRGVTWDKRAKKWRGSVKHNKKTHTAGNFVEIKDAEAAVIALRNELFTHNDADRVADR